MGKSDQYWILIIQKILGEKEFIKNTQFIENYLSKHNQLYKTSKTTQDFAGELIDQNDPIIMFAGYGGNHYGDREIGLIKAVSRLDYDYVLHLLTSMNPEDQTLGVMGMRKFKSKGMTIDENASEVIRHLINRNTSIPYHITCVGGESKLNSFLDRCDWNKALDVEIKQKNPN